MQFTVNQGFIFRFGGDFFFKMKSTYFTGLSCLNLLFFEVLPENRNSRNSLNFRSLLCFFVLKSDPAGIRTQDPNIKSVVLYQLSY